MPGRVPEGALTAPRHRRGGHGLTAHSANANRTLVNHSHCVSELGCVLFRNDTRPDACRSPVSRRGHAPPPARESDEQAHHPTHAPPADAPSGATEDSSGRDAEGLRAPSLAVSGDARTAPRLDPTAPSDRPLHYTAPLDHTGHASSALHATLDDDAGSLQDHIRPFIARATEHDVTQFPRRRVAESERLVVRGGDSVGLPSCSRPRSAFDSENVARAPRPHRVNTDRKTSSKRPDNS